MGDWKPDDDDFSSTSWHISQINILVSLSILILLNGFPDFFTTFFNDALAKGN